MPLEVLAWPADAGRLARCWTGRGLVVIGVQTPATTIRDTARAAIRTALREALGLLLGCAPDAVPLASSSGNPLRLDMPETPIALSVSHEPGLSIAAIRRGGGVGADIMRIDETMEWELVAADYLGPHARARIAGASEFAREWTRLEAALKCRGMALREWHPDVETLLRQLTFIDLSLPEGFAGAVALAANP
ncbi:4'-phosphopantetheinyl transferase family protein [Noviherbaspirillum sp. ST9]|uniref:4'-phosphopantetheinyl transferase family protein n=1 Tax=Noviherbaspirillum sp. ST9 TaxID=3401606 RepID=UPI003B586F13